MASNPSHNWKEVNVNKAYTELFETDLELHQAETKITKHMIEN